MRKIVWNCLFYFPKLGQHMFIPVQRPNSPHCCRRRCHSRGLRKPRGAPKWVEISTGEVVQEIPEDSEATESQAPPWAQVPATADRLALSLGFRPAGDIGRGVTGSMHSTTGCPSEQTCWTSPPFSRLYLFQTASYLFNYTSSKDLL